MQSLKEIIPLNTIIRPLSTITFETRFFDATKQLHISLVHARNIISLIKTTEQATAPSVQKANH